MTNVANTLEHEWAVPVMDHCADDIRQILIKARSSTLRNINSSMVMAYWMIGERIKKLEEKRKSSGNSGNGTLRGLSKALTKELGNGFSYSNLKNMRQFYLTYPDPKICFSVLSKLSWSHNCLIMRVSDPKARFFYLKEASENQWSVRQLERNISTYYYQRLLSSEIENSGPKTDYPSDIRSFIKDPYVLEFLGLPETKEFSERDLEDNLMKNLQDFLLELGKGFSFVGRQYRISTESTHFYIDLVFYNYILKCFVLIDLKTTKLTHQDIGQMDMYRRMFDDLKKTESDNPTIGILLCTGRDETVVKYSVMNDVENIFASKYLPYLPTEEELREELESRYLRMEE